MIGVERSKKMLLKMVRYGVVGMIGTGTHFLLLILLVEWGGVHPFVGSCLGFIAALIASYFLNRTWTFVTVAEGRGRRGIFLKYTVVSLIGLMLNMGMMYVFLTWLVWPYLCAQAMVVFVVPLSNFLLNYYWTFDGEKLDLKR